ncbi:MAG: hypothetical protein JWN62_2399 [Acidimicrobiales bacterium]|nr:hypothetical protein [Acidimicrobiales bacterium]
MVKMRALTLAWFAVGVSVVSSSCASESTTGASTTVGSTKLTIPAPATAGSTSASTAAGSTSTSTSTPTAPTTTSVRAAPTSIPDSVPAAMPVDCAEMVSGDHDVEVGGEARRFVVAAPAGLDRSAAAQPAPVIVLFHGFNSTAEEILVTTGLERLGPDHGVVVVAPQGIGSPTSWHIGDASFGDTEFTDRVLELVRASPCIDPAMVWLAGFSAGSAWTGVYGCAHTEGIAGLLMHSGLAPPICPAASTPDLMIVHGTADPVVPFAGGAQTVDSDSVQLSSVPESSAGWAATAGCDASPVITSAGAHVEIVTWSGCLGGRTVSLQAVDGLGHTWAGGTGAPDVLNPGCVLVQRLTGAAAPAASCLP